MEQQSFYDNSIFWVELERILPNPYQPRKEFDDSRLSELAESIRQYGVLQPLVVTRHEEVHEDGGLSVHYELIAGERRLRASKIAGLSQVPVIIRSGEEQGKLKLELAIVENLQREDLNPLDRARAFMRLIKEFEYKHSEVAVKVGKSREYISNTLRLLNLPDEMQDAIVTGKMTEGHSRPLLMLDDRVEEQSTLFKEVVLRKLTVRETEKVARRIAIDRVRKKKDLSVEMIELERELTETLGTRVQIAQGEVGGKVLIDYFSAEDLRNLLSMLHGSVDDKENGLISRFIGSLNLGTEDEQNASAEGKSASVPALEEVVDTASEPAEKEDSEEDDDLYSIKNFSI